MYKILVMNFFPAFFPPASGGELRYFNIYNELSKYYDVTLLSPTYSNHSFKVIEHNSSFREYRVPKEFIHDELHMQLDQEDVGSEVSALVCALSARTPNMYHKYYNDLYKESDIIVHEFPYMLEYDLYFGLDNKPRIYNSHNYESNLIKQIWKGTDAAKYIKYIGDLEKNLVEKADIVFATSAEERETFIYNFNVDEKKVKLAPNGINPGKLDRDKKLIDKQNKINTFFIGSAHPPNVEAVNFIIHELADNLPEVKFNIAGSCCDSFNNVKKSNVNLLGKIGEEEKNILFKNADIAINPMFSGAGTNLKTLEYLSAGIPLISTNTGVRGLGLINGQHFIEADKNNFVKKLKDIIHNSDSLTNIASSAKQFINKTYSWDKIAEDISLEIKALKPEKPDKKTIIVLNDFEVAQPISGGEIRINKLYSQLANYYQIVLLCLNQHGYITKTQIKDSFVQISIPKTKEHIQEETHINAQYWISATDIVNSYMCIQNELLMKVYHNLYDTTSLIVASHPYMIMMVDDYCEKPVIYESHNLETQLKKSILEGHPQYKKLIKQVELIEKRACEVSLFIISVTDNENELFNEFCNGTKKEIVTIKNGVELKESNYDDLQFSSVRNLFGKHPVIMFIGSAHQPNVEAASFIINTLAPQLEHCYFIVIGSVCDAFTDQGADNVLLFGKLDDLYKQALMKISDVAVNPMLRGSGSNLKLAEYFSKHLPTVTTPFGARGFHIKNNEHAIICNLDEFGEKIEYLLENEELQERLVKKSYEYVVKELDWTVLARKYYEVLEEKIFNEDVKKRVLVITYRFTDPPLGGAEVYLSKVLQEISKIGDFSIDIATLNIHSLYNKFHFSIDYTTDNNYRFYKERQGLNVYKFKVDDLPENVQYENCVKLFRCWMEESIESSISFINQYSNPILLGGWYFPEKKETSYEVWSGEDAIVFVGDSTEVILNGYSPKKRELTITSGERVVYSSKVKGKFSIYIPKVSTSVLRLNIQPFYAEGDPRALGIRVKSIQCILNDEKVELDLSVSYRDILKNNDLDSYVNELIRIANKRDEKMDYLFQSTRGPVSSELDNWLDKNIKKYDVILGHSVPFHTSVLATKYAKKYEKPVILLPHFHLDDEFYHWKSYYDAMRESSGVIIFPKVAMDLFYNKIKVKDYYLPGGAVSKEECCDVSSSAFMRKYNSDVPFALVLGRKTGSKNYKWAIEAIEKLNKGDKKCNLVIIGKDEDGEEIHSEHVRYMGELRREEVLGALKESFCLVTMSESESFGMVILEAWMQKKPVIVSEKSYASVELVQDGVNGLLANQDNLSEKVKLLLNDRELAEFMGASGYQKVSTEYTWEYLGNQFNEIFRDQISKRL